MGESNSEVPSPQTNSATEVSGSTPHRNSRFKFLAGITAAGIALFGGKPQTVQAQLRPIPGLKPDNPNTPDNPAQPENKSDREKPPPPPEIVKNQTEKAVKTLTPFMNSVSGVNVEYFPSETPNAQTNYAYNINDEEVYTVNNSLIVFYPSDENLYKDLDLLVKQQLVVLGSRTFKNYPSEMFAKDFKLYTGVDIKPIVSGVTKLSADSQAQAQLQARSQARVNELSTQLDLSEYKQSNPADLGNSSENTAERLYADIVTQFFSDKDLKVRILKASESDRKIIANLYLAALKRAADCFGVGGDFKNSGVNQRSIDDLLHISGNESYQKYFAEKRNPDTANNLHLVETEEYKAFIAQSVPKAA